MGISKRLETIAKYVTPGYRAADIGTDHGYVPIYLLRNQISPHVIAVDLSRDSLAKAEQNIARAGLSEQIECRISDGLSSITPGEVDTIVISGMGGILMDRILRTNMNVVNEAKELVLSPHRDSDLIREFARENDFVILTDEQIMDRKKHYTIIKIRIKK